MKILVYAGFFVVWHMLSMLTFTFSTHHRNWTWALPMAALIGALLGWTFYSLRLHGFFVPHLVIALAAFWAVAAHNRTQAEMVLFVAAKKQERELADRMAASLARTRAGIRYSVVAFTGGFAVSFLYLVNQR